MFRLLMFFYSFIYTAGLIIYLPFFLGRIIRERRSLNLIERAGKLPAAITQAPGSQLSRLWIHAVSVGEVNVIHPLIGELGLAPDQLFISTITTSGQQLATRLFGERCHLFYFPLDWKWVCRRYLRAIEPSAVVLTETEIWPGFIAAASSLGIPVILINGRISDRSFRRYRRIRPLLRPVVSRISRFCMQSRQDRDRILEMGADPARVNWVGNLKYDYQLEERPEKTRLVETLRQVMRPAENGYIWVCGSTREGEEEALLQAYLQLQPDVPSLRLILAPRHPHRAGEIAALLRTLRLDYIARSGWDPLPDGRGSDKMPVEPTAHPSRDRKRAAPVPPRVFILDSIGELPYIYQLADVVFIGGSLVPTGGHNVIEAASFGKPILFGPHMENFQEVADTFLESYAALQVKSPEELAARLRDLLKDPDSRNWLGRNARKVIRENQGAVKRTVEILRGECSI